MMRLWADALMCMAAPSLARWTVAVVDRHDGTEYPVASVRLRWRGSVDAWIRYAHEHLIDQRHEPLAGTATYAARPLPRPR